MLKQTTSAVAALRGAISKFGEAHPEAVRRFHRGQRIINQGDIGDECFLIKEGAVGILVRDETSGAETQITLRFEGDLIGETAFLQQNARRTATVEVVSEEATLVRLTKKDIFVLLRNDPTLDGVITLLWDLAASRQHETLQVLEGRISVQNRFMSVILADIHNFSALGEAVWEESINSFLFDFVEQCEEIAQHYKGLFEDQGDGFKILFRDTNHANRSVECAVNIKETFERLRSVWAQRNDAFDSIGLGIGICSDCMSIRKRGEH